MMAALSVIFPNMRRYHQILPKFSACSLSMYPDFIALVEIHPVTGPLQMHLPKTYIVAAHDCCDGGKVLLLCRDNLLVGTVDCEMYYVTRTSLDLAIREYTETVIIIHIWGLVIIF